MGHATQLPRSFPVDSAKWFMEGPRKSINRGNAQAWIKLAPTDIPIRIEISAPKRDKSGSQLPSIEAKFVYPSDSEPLDFLSGPTFSVKFGKFSGRIKELRAHLHAEKLQRDTQPPFETVIKRLEASLASVKKEIPSKLPRKARMELNNDLLRNLLEGLLENSK